MKNEPCEQFYEAPRYPGLPRRLTNAYIHLLEFDFHPENRFVPQFLLANGNQLQCRIGGLCINSANVEIDYARLDALINGFHPKTCKVCSLKTLDEDHALLFTHRVFSGKIDHVEFDVNTSRNFFFRIYG